MSQGGCLSSLPTSFTVGADFVDVSSEVFILTLIRDRQGISHGPVRGRVVGMCQAVCLSSVPTSFVFGADMDNVWNGAFTSTPWWASHSKCLDRSPDSWVQILFGMPQGGFMFFVC
eukprot:2497682-Pyramimonas_sp.AAC.1